MTDFTGKYEEYKNIINNNIECYIKKSEPVTLYNPLKYILSGGGKRIRPVLLMFCCEASGGNPTKAIDAAIAVEILHNFTLIHDDIMDNAVTRRGKETIHKKWDLNIAILAGDNMVGLAYESLLKTKSDRIKEILAEFTSGIIEVCEGQSYDKEFENSTGADPIKEKNIGIEDYFMMIEKKTSKLLTVSAVIGGLIGNANEVRIQALKAYSRNLGLAFQILDDLLDITADKKKFGKKTGGDLIEGKKTFLLLKALETIDKQADREILTGIIKNKGIQKDFNETITKVKKIYEEHGILNFARKEIEKYTALAEEQLSVFDISDGGLLKWYSQMLLGRGY
jgi:geranylgeranyl diphosphate synthase, type II